MKLPALLAGSYVILVTAVLLGLIVPGADLIPGLATPAELGLGSNRVGIEPLTDRFIDRALGPGATSSGQRLDRVGSRGRGVGGRAVDEVLGEVVDHAFTNNDQANAYEVTRLPFTGRTTTADADREVGEPECGTQLGGTVWYRYTAMRKEALLADTFGTRYQTSLAVYRQSSNGMVSLENACDFDPQGNSQIKFDVNKGTTYFFQIGATVRGGALTFHLKRFGSTMLASVSSTGEPGNAPSVDPSVSVDGRYVAFASQATNLIRGLHGSAYTTCIACYNVFLRDRLAGTTSLVSAALDGRGGNDNSYRPQVSDDGRYVAFGSYATNIVAGDSNNIRDAFVRDMKTGRTERVSVSSRGEQARRDSQVFYRNGTHFLAMSADGRYVSFSSASSNLVEGDDDSSHDVFVRDTKNDTTRLVSLDNGGKDPPLDVILNSFSRDGRWVVFLSSYPMSERDGDLSQDVFVRDLWTGTTELASVPEVANAREGFRDAVLTPAVSRSISDDGRFVVFGSDGALVDGDTNGVVDVFVRDRLRKTTERVSVSSSGGQGVGATTSPPLNTGDDKWLDWSISGDGSTVAFTTDLDLLEPSDQNGANDVFVHDRTNGETLRVSPSGDVAGGYAPQISGDGMFTTFYGSYPLSHRDTNKFNDVFVFSPLVTQDQNDHLLGCAAGEDECLPTVAANASVRTAPCSASSEYTRVGLAGAHEDVTPSLFPSIETIVAHDPRAYTERSVVRFKYRIDVSQSSAAPSARTADVRIALSWDNPYGLLVYDDYDLYVYDANGELLAYSFNTNGSVYYPFGSTGSGELVLVSPVPHCSDLRVDIVNNLGLPTTKMALDTTLGSLE